MAKKSLCILYGLNEGPAIGKRFENALRAAGYQIVRKPTDADVIFAHSGGCFLLPDNTSTKLVLLVGLAYWPRKAWLPATAQKVGLEFKTQRKQKQLARWTLKWLYHIRYFFSLRMSWQMARNRGLGSSWNNEYRQIIVRNRNDAYCTPAIAAAKFRGPRTFISLPGEHDDCWYNPSPYIDLLRSLA